jgi:hypothetical protein
MSIVLTDDNLQWISNHPIIRQNIINHINSILKYHHIYQNENEYRDIEEFKRQIISKLENLYQSFDTVNSDYYNFKNGFKSHIKDIVRNYILENNELKNIIDKNLETLKSELTSHGEVILTTLLNDTAYQHIADAHLNTLNDKLTISYNNFLDKNNEIIIQLEKKVLKQEKELVNMKNKYENHKFNFHNLESAVNTGFIIMGCMVGLYCCYKLALL